MPTEDFREGTLTLFQYDRVQALEWSFDMPWNGAIIESWCSDLIDKFSDQGTLTGHGVNLSPLSARFSSRQEDWLNRTREEFQKHKYVHATEHFGFSEAGPFAQGAPLAVPMDSESLKCGREMLKRYAEATGCPVGLENLAFAFNMEDVKRQGEFLFQLISAVHGFIVLDLHNLYCQIENFKVSDVHLLSSYPLDHVRELHVSGGSWSESKSGKRAAVRRDTHDGPVPPEVFGLVIDALKKCQNVEFVILEQLGNTMPDFESRKKFREDFKSLEKILEFHNA